MFWPLRYWICELGTAPPIKTSAAKSDAPTLQPAVSVDVPLITARPPVLVGRTTSPLPFRLPGRNLGFVLVLAQRDVLADADHHVLDGPVAKAFPVSRLRVAPVLVRVVVPADRTQDRVRRQQRRRV